VPPTRLRQTACAVEGHLRKAEAIRAILDVDHEKIADALIDRHFDPAVVIEEAFGAAPARWTGHEGASAWLAENVVEATHGETVVGTIGRGSGPGEGAVVWVGGPGQAATVFEFRGDRFIRIRVFAAAGPALAAAGLSDYELSTDEDGRTSVIFGDGRAGARPSPGVIVSARYRTGSGEAGSVEADAVTVVAARPGTDVETDSQDCIRRALAHVPPWFPPATAAALLVASWNRARGRRDREADDLAITLSEIMAAASDLIAYYQDRVAGEAYLNTARKRRSIRDHARLVDYRPQPAARRRRRCRKRRASG
jgi:hypothetical protein